MTTTYLTVFNDHFIDFITDIQNVFPENADVLTAKNALIAIRKANPKIIVKIWNTFVVGKYKGEIEAGNLDFFFEKDYSSDMTTMPSASKILEAIDRLRQPVKQMGPENRAKTMKYIQNLTKISALCE